jgi:hypothetical protein
LINYIGFYRSKLDLTDFNTRKGYFNELEVGIGFLLVAKKCGKFKENPTS